MTDVLEKLDVKKVAAFYRRLADFVEVKVKKEGKGKVSFSIAALLLRRWLDNRDRKSVFQFDAPAHLKNYPDVLEALRYHRRVYLSEEQARLPGGARQTVGVLPRLQGTSKLPRWDVTTNSTISLEYHSLVEISLSKQFIGNAADLDLLYGFRGFQVQSRVSITGTPLPARSRLKLEFNSFEAYTFDRYDWNYAEYLTVPNPDYQSQFPDAVAPKSENVVVYHINAKRLEDAGLAAPYDVKTNLWDVASFDTSLKKPKEIELAIVPSLKSPGR